MRNVDLVEDFVCGAKGGKGSNLYIDGIRLVNYSTIIALRIDGKIFLNNKFIKVFLEKLYAGVPVVAR